MESLAQRLAHTDRQIVEGIGLAVRQKEMIKELERRGLDSSQSKATLSAFLQTLRRYVERRDQMIREREPRDG
jgi:hypothetical protein